MKVLKFILLLFCAVQIGGCNEILNYYSSEYSLKYRRPISLMMSHELDSLNLSGQGVKIGVMDGGFGDFKSNAFTKRLNVVAYSDFVDGDTTGFFLSRENNHGTKVTSNIGGRDSNLVFGLAHNAEYYLAKAEDVSSELSSEEDIFIEAIQWLVDMEVDIINISIAYTKFEDVEYYTQSELNGHTARCSRYLDSLLSAHPDLIVVVSAGNKGNKEWRNIMFPADVQQAITVGSCDFEGISRWKSSGIGPAHLPYVKPDVVTYPIPTGNSFSTPVISGFIALLKEWKPTLTREEIIEGLHTTSSNTERPNREIGYGIPQSDLLLEFLQK